MTRFMFNFSRLLTTSMVLSLAACASMTDTPNQMVQVLTPGAEHAKCTLTTDYAKYVANPPETIFIRRMQEPLKVHCVAPGNRERTTFAYPRKNGSAMGNVVTGGITTLYDHFSGALYKYPSPIIVDFRHTIATKNALPAYYAPDTISPFDQKPASTTGRATHPDFGDEPAPLIEKDSDKSEDKDTGDTDTSPKDSEKSDSKSGDDATTPTPAKK